MTDALEGYQIKNGKKQHDESMFPDEESRKALRARLERERGDA